MLSIKQAAQQAAQYLAELLPTVEDVRLEEVESTDTDWLITLSYLADRPSEEQLRATLTFSSAKIRQYKIFTIGKISGEVTSMKIRNVQGV